MKKKLLLIAFTCILQKPGVVTAQDSYSINHYTADNGLPQNSIKSIAADTKGFVWLATEDGLARFDGQRFSIFNKGNLHLTGTNWMTIQPSSRKSIEKEEGPNHREQTRVSYAMFGENEAVRIEGGKAVRDTHFNADRKQKMGLVAQHPEDILYSIGLPNLWGNHSTSKHYLVSDGSEEGNFFLCDNSRVSYYQHWKKKYETVFATSDLLNYFSIGGRLYYWTEQKDFAEVSNKKIVKWPMAGDIFGDMTYKPGNPQVKLFWNNNSDQAFIVLNKHLYALEQQKDGRLLTRLLLKDFDFASKAIQVIHYDRAVGKIYLGSSTDGLYVLNKRQFQTVTVKGGNRFNVFYAQLPHTQNTVLTSTGTVVGKDERTSRIIEKQLPVLQRINPTDKRVLIRDKAQRIWVKSYQVLFCLDRDGKKILGRWNFQNEIKALHLGKDGYVWIGEKEQGLYRLNPDHPTFPPRPFTADSLKNITCIVSVTDQVLLVGTMAGLYKIHLNNKKIQLVVGTNDLFIKSIFVSAQNQIWIAAQEKGLCLLTRTGKIITFPLDRNRFLSSPHCVVDDGSGYLWIPTNKGLFQMAIKDLLRYATLNTDRLRKTRPNKTRDSLPSELFYLYHAKDEGFLTNEFNGNCHPCAAVLPNGYVSLPSLNGLVWFRPEQISSYTPGFDIILDKAEVDGRIISSPGDTVHLPLDPQHIKLYFATAHFGNDYNLNLSYALLEQNKPYQTPKWIPLDTRDFSIRYSSLNPGDYTLIIKKLNGFGINNYSIKKIHISVPKSWYETTWAMFLFIAAFNLILILLIGFYNGYRLRLIRQENIRLDRLVIERTTTLNRALKDLEVSKNQMSQQIHLFSRLLASITHDVQSPLKFVTYASESIFKTADGKQSKNIKKLASIITDLTARMSTMLQDLSEYIKIQVYGNNLHFESINLKALIDMKLDFFKNVIESNESHFKNDIGVAARVESDYQLLSIIIHNLIDNAAKYTHHGKIRISFRIQKGHKTELVISNSGSGLSEEMMDTLNNSGLNSQPGNEPVKKEKVVGLGLLIVKELCELLGITLSVTQTDVTSFHLVFEQNQAL